MSGHWLGVDAGGTKTHALILDDDANVIAEAFAGPGNPLAAGDEIAFASLKKALGQASEDAHPHGAHFGVAGAGRPADRLRVEQLLARLDLDCPVGLSDDACIAFRAAAEPPGAVVVAGTGSIAVAYDARGTRHRSGGHGYLLGDEGSGYWIGVEAVRRSLWATDGRGPETRLCDFVPRTLGVASLDEVVSGAYSSEIGRDDLARLAPDIVVFDDPVARSITLEAVAHLVGAAAAVAGRARLGDAAPVVLSGGLLRECEPFKALLQEHLAEEMPGVRAVTPTRPPAFGAALLARSGTS